MNSASHGCSCRAPQRGSHNSMGVVAAAGVLVGLLLRRRRQRMLPLAALALGGSALAGAAGLILLVAMVGAIMLTLRHRADVRRQSISAQLARTRAQSVEVVKVPIGSGGG